MTLCDAVIAQGNIKTGRNKRAGSFCRTARSVSPGLPNFLPNTTCALTTFRCCVQLAVRIHPACPRRASWDRRHNQWASPYMSGPRQTERPVRYWQVDAERLNALTNPTTLSDNRGDLRQSLATNRNKTFAVARPSNLTFSTKTSNCPHFNYPTHLAARNDTITVMAPGTIHNDTAAADHGTSLKPTARSFHPTGTPDPSKYHAASSEDAIHAEAEFAAHNYHPLPIGACSVPSDVC